MLTHGLRVRVRHGELFYPRQSTLTSVCHSSLIRRVYGTLICDMSLWHYGDGGISEGSTAEGDGSELERFEILGFDVNFTLRSGGKSYTAISAADG